MLNKILVKYSSIFVYLKMCRGTFFIKKIFGKASIGSFSALFSFIASLENCTLFTHEVNNFICIHFVQAFPESRLHKKCILGQSHKIADSFKFFPCTCFTILSFIYVLYMVSYSSVLSTCIINKL